MPEGSGGLAAHARRLRDAAEAMRARARRLGAQVETIRWEGIAASRFLAEVGIGAAEMHGIALAADRAAEALELHAARLAIDLAGCGR